MDERVPKSELEAATLRIRQLEDEVARVRYGYSSHHRQQAFKMLEAAWGNVNPHNMESDELAQTILGDIKALEAALAAEAGSPPVTQRKEKANG